MAGLFLWSIGLLLAAAAVTSAQENRDGLFPPALDARASRIRQALAANNLPLAAREAQQLASGSPGSFASLFWGGYIAYRQARYYDAVRALRQAEALDPNPYVLKVLALSYHGAHQHRLFLLTMSAARQKQPDDFAPYYYLGRYYDSDLTDFVRAAEYFQQAVARRPDHFPSHYYLGHCYEQEQKMELAEAEYRKAIDLAERQGTHDALSYQGLASVRLSQNRAADALTFANRALQLAPRDAPAHKLLAKIYSDLGRTADAAAEWKAASTLDPTDAPALYRLYRTYQALGQAENARAALAQYQRIANLYGTN